MDTAALQLSLKLALATMVALLPLALALAWVLTRSTFRGKVWLEAVVLLPLVLPPTVLGFYLLTALGAQSPLGAWLHAQFGVALTFNFAGLLLASLIFNLPFMVQPIQLALAAVPRDLREAAAVSGLREAETFWRIELPLAWRGIVAALLLTFVHTLGEFGVVLMIGGNIPGETRTMALAIYDRVQALDFGAAHQMAFVLLAISVAAIVAVLTAAQRRQRPT